MWNLKFEGINHIIHEGPDSADRWRDMNALLDHFRARPDTKCLQVGINHPYTENHAPHFVSIDKYDQNPAINVRRPLSDSGFEDKSL